MEKRTPQRASVNGTRHRLRIKGQEAGYVYRIVHDIDDRVQNLLDYGYEVVTDSNVKVGDKRAGAPASAPGSVQTVSLGQGDKGVVMRIKQELYDQRQADKHAEVKVREAMLKDPSQNGADYGSIKLSRG